MRPLYAVSAFVAFLAALITVVIYFTGAQTFDQLVAVLRGEKIQTATPAPPQGTPAARSTPRTAPGADETGAAPNPATIELEYWRSVRATNDISTYQEYLKRYPNGQFVSIAQARIEELKRSPYPGVPSLVHSTPTQYRSDAFQFEMTAPAGWTTMEGYGFDGVRVRMLSPRYASDQAGCWVWTADRASLSSATQENLNAEVARGDTLVVIERGVKSIDANFAMGAHPIVDVGTIKGQQADVTFINKLGVRVQQRQLLVFIPGRIYQAICEAATATFPNDETDFDAILGSFRVTAH